MTTSVTTVVLTIQSVGSFTISWAQANVEFFTRTVSILLSVEEFWIQLDFTESSLRFRARSLQSSTFDVVVAFIDPAGGTFETMAELLMGSNGSSVSVGDTSSTMLTLLEEVLVDEGQTVPDGLTESTVTYVAEAFQEAFVADLPTWVTGTWSECSVACGDGTTSRTVACSASYGDVCEGTLGPAPMSSASCSQSCDDSVVTVAGIVVTVTVASCCALCAGACLILLWRQRVCKAEC